MLNLNLINLLIDPIEIEPDHTLLAQYFPNFFADALIPIHPN